jgi:hypothetical protein
MLAGFSGGGAYDLLWRVPAALRARRDAKEAGWILRTVSSSPAT